MHTLLLRLQGPMQSWGTTSRFDERDTQLEPSKSGVLGLVCAALGRDRAEPVADLAALRMGVRCDREGAPMRDYQTAGGDRDPARKTMRLASGEAKNRTVVSHRYYLADAAFLVGLEGRDCGLLADIHAALHTPHWPLTLGRKSFPPGLPVCLPGGLVDLSLEQALRTWPRLAASSRRDHAAMRLVLEDERQGSMRFDQPAGPFAARVFGPRSVRTEMLMEVANVPDTPET